VKRFYLRWSGILALGIILVLAAVQRYRTEVSVISPDQLRTESSSIPVRIQGRIEPGSLKIDPDGHQALFDLSGQKKRMPIHYSGDDIDNLREFKIIVLIGSWEPAIGRFESKKMALTPNYGFIASAYLIGLIPLAFFIFNMERKVVLLYDTIKQEKIYQSEETL
jgi:cytochrome c-type biogenesis protein CcmE